MSLKYKYKDNRGLRVHEPTVSQLYSESEITEEELEILLGEEKMSLNGYVLHLLYHMSASLPFCKSMPVGEEK